MITVISINIISRRYNILAPIILSNLSPIFVQDLKHKKRANHQNIQFINFEYMEELPDKLTNNGICRFTQPTSLHESDELVLQVIKISEDCESNKICVLSDGFAEIRGHLKDEARLKQIKKELLCYNIVKISKGNYQFRGSENNPAFVLKDCRVVSDLIMLRTVGEPLSYLAYQHNGNRNDRGSGEIATGQKQIESSTIKSLIEGYPYPPNKWFLRAKIVKKPDNINEQKPFLCIKLMDEAADTIQGIFFGNLALEYCQRLRYNGEYVFSNGQIKLKKGENNVFEIKFNESSQILPVDKNAIKPKPENNNKDSSTVSQILAKDQAGILVTIVGKITKISYMKMNKGRSMCLIDRNLQEIEIVLWKQFTQVIQCQKTYKFENLRTKKYNNMISLQSVPMKTVITEAESKNIMIQQNQNARPEFRKQIYDYKKLLNVTELLDIQVTDRIYRDVNGFLIIHTAYLETKNYFWVKCTKCDNKDISLNYEEKPQCKKCSTIQDGIEIKWNIRSHIIDDRESVKCILNDQLAIKFLKMTSVQGFSLLIKEPEIFKKKISEISHIEGNFKIKLNPFNGTIYYNIVDMYKNDSLVILKKEKKQLMEAMHRYIKQTSKPHSETTLYKNENNYNQQQKNSPEKNIFRKEIPQQNTNKQCDYMWE